MGWLRSLKRERDSMSELTGVELDFYLIFIFLRKELDFLYDIF